MITVICKKCGTELSEESLFCTECGQKVVAGNFESDNNRNAHGVAKENIEKYSFKLDKLISKYGETNIIKFTVYAGLAFLLSIKIFGFLLTAILLTIANGYLIFSKYRNNRKFDKKTVIFSLLVLFAGIVCKII